MITVLDVETTTTYVESKDKDSPSPFIPENKLVCVGYLGVDKKCVWFYHKDREADQGGFEQVQKVLDDTTLLVGHNVKFDLQWLLEAGFKYTGNIYDTMLAQYILNGSQKSPLSLLYLAEKYDVARKAVDLLVEYEGKGMEEIPWEIVEEYNLADLQATLEVAWKQLDQLGSSWDEFDTHS